MAGVSLLSSFFYRRYNDVRNLLPDAFYISDFGLSTKLSFRTDFTSHLLHFCCERSELFDHPVDGVDEIEHFSRDTDALDFGREVTSSDGRLSKLNIRRPSVSASVQVDVNVRRTVANAMVRTWIVS